MLHTAVTCFSAFLFLSAVSLFSPDRRFLFGDLAKLEAVMGVQIMSVLASHVSQLASLSGVPQSQSVEELISQWCAGLGSVSPTWKHLLEAISGVGLPELREQIEAFMKGQQHITHNSLLHNNIVFFISLCLAIIFYLLSPLALILLFTLSILLHYYS